MYIYIYMHYYAKIYVSSYLTRQNEIYLNLQYLQLNKEIKD